MSEHPCPLCLSVILNAVKNLEVFDCVSDRNG